MRRLISDAGYEPMQRRTLYDECKDACCATPIPVPKERAGTFPVVSGGLESEVASA
jgi:hypothetical protein